MITSIEFDPGNFSNEEIYDITWVTDELHESFSSYRKWIGASEIYQTLPVGIQAEWCPNGCSSFDDCEFFYRKFNELIEKTVPDNPPTGWPGALSSAFLADLLDGPDFDPARKVLSCPFKLWNTSDSDGTFATRPCPEPKRERWISHVSYEFNDGGGNLERFVLGDIDDDGVLYEPLGNASLASKLREVFLRENPSNCTLESVCEPPQDCSQVGTRFTASPSKSLQPSQWAYLVLTALANINQQMFNQFEALQSAAIEGSLTAFNIDDYFPKPGKNLALKNILTGLSTVLAAVSGFIPFIGPGLVALEVAGATAGALGAIASGAGVYFERALQNNVDRSDPNIAQKRFAPIVRQVFRVFSESMDNITAELLRGERIDGTFDVYDMMRGGAWVDRSALSRIPYLQEQVYNEITSRAIDGLWKTPTSNKMWVLFVDLGDDDDKKWKCGNDTSGPPTMKYCADHGVYYAYNFVEKGDLIGHRNYPWGADKMKLNLGIDPAWITEASAKTYKLSTDSKTGHGLDPSNFDATLGANHTLFYIANGSDINGPDGKGLGGRYPGSWTLPVCNASTWGAAWNYDYTKGPRDELDIREHPPCFCGEGGLETAKWATAAGLHDFSTFYQRCKRVLENIGEDPPFAWPDGVTSVDLGFREPIMRPDA